MSLWDFYGFVPERYNLNTHSIPNTPASYGYALRPEFVESLFYLDRAFSRASGSDSNSYVDSLVPEAEWQRFGLRILNALESECRVSCGYASIKNVSRATSIPQSGIVSGSLFEIHNHMPSFFISETLKYLYLLFDPRKKHWIDQGNFVFSTEGHIFPVNDTFWGVSHSGGSSSKSDRDKHSSTGILINYESKKRWSELREFAHAKCLRSSPLLELRFAMFADAGQVVRSGFLGRTVGRCQVCNMSPRHRMINMAIETSVMIGGKHFANSVTCSREESRYFSPYAPLWVDDDAPQQHQGRGSDSLVYESRLIEKNYHGPRGGSDWIFVRNAETIEWELQRSQALLRARPESHEKQNPRLFFPDLDTIFMWLAFGLECMMRLFALIFFAVSSLNGPGAA